MLMRPLGESTYFGTELEMQSQPRIPVSSGRVLAQGHGAEGLHRILLFVRSGQPQRDDDLRQSISARTLHHRLDEHPAAAEPSVCVLDVDEETDPCIALNAGPYEILIDVSNSGLPTLRQPFVRFIPRHPGGDGMAQQAPAVAVNEQAPIKWNVRERVGTQPKIAEIRELPFRLVQFSKAVK